MDEDMLQKKGIVFYYISKRYALGSDRSDGMFRLVGFYVTLYWISTRQERFGILDKVAR